MSHRQSECDACAEVADSKIDKDEACPSYYEVSVAYLNSQLAEVRDRIRARNGWQGINP